MQREVRAAQVDANDPVPLVRHQIVNWSPHPINAGVVDNGIQAADPGQKGRASTSNLFVRRRYPHRK